MARTPTSEQVEQLRSAVVALTADPPQELSRPTLAASTRTVCGLLAARHPGGTVELRVPPFAAAQLGIGERGRHTRGTPPNVVQTDPVTLLRLAAGDLSWTDAVTGRAVSASGVLSDLSELWPLSELA